MVKDSGANLPADADSIEAYVPIQGNDAERGALILHSREDPALLARGIAAAVNEGVSISLMRASWENLLEGERKLAALIGSIGVVATILAAAGMFALVAFAATQRKRELGIRIALGAKNRHILNTLLAQNAKPTIYGAAAGAILAALLSRLVNSFIVLPNGGTTDIVGFVAGLACFILVAALATILPAVRALRIDPSKTLREE